MINHEDGVDVTNEETLIVSSKQEDNKARWHLLKQYDIFTIDSSVSDISDDLHIGRDTLYYAHPNKSGSLDIIDDIESKDSFLRIIQRDTFDNKEGITFVVSKDKESVYDKIEEDKVIQMYLFKKGN
jgi:hypothetical protein